MKTGKTQKPRRPDEVLARVLADYQNLLKRIEREREETQTRANKGLVSKLLPVLDILQTAQEHLGDNGLEAAIDQFEQVLTEAGVARVETKVGDKFDENMHEAIDTEHGGRQATVAKVVARGYKWKDGLLLRPAKVVVYGKEPEKEKELDREMIRGDYP